MPFLLLGIVLIWTILVFRLICFRTTMGPRTLLTFLTLGALLGTVANPLAEKFFNSYRFDGSALYVLLMIASQHFLMASPVLLLLGRAAWRRGSSLCDAFLAAFAIGLGYEFLGAFLALAPAREIASGFSFLPPGVASTPTLTVAGYAYWTGLVALACVMALRFLRSAVLAILAGAIALSLCALDHYGDFWNTPLAEHIRTFSLHGAVLPWLVIALLLGGVVLEGRWAQAAGGMKNFVAELQAVAAAHVAFRWSEANRTGAGYRLRRQSEILAAELRRDSHNPFLQQQASAVAGLLSRLAQAPIVPAGNALDWTKRRWPQLLAIAAFLVFGFVLFMPGVQTLSAWIWNWVPVAAPFAPFQLTLLSTVLVLLLLWQYVAAPPRAFSSVIVDELAQFSAERLISQLGLGVVIMVVLYPHPLEFIAFQSTLATGAGLQVPGISVVQGITLLLLLSWAAETVTARRAELWRRAASGDHLRSLVHNFVSAFSAAAVAWLAFAFFTEAQVYAHAHWGATFFNRFLTNGNSILEMALGSITAAFAFGAAWIVQLVASRFERTFLQAAGGPSPPAPLRPAAAPGTGR